MGVPTQPKQLHEDTQRFPTTFAISTAHFIMYFIKNNTIINTLIPNVINIVLTE